MPYTIGKIIFSRKSEITEKCREILSSTVDGSSIPTADQVFLFELFQFHDEWSQKSDGGVVDISTKTTEHGARCFILLKSSQESIDISFQHAIKLIPTSRAGNLTPQKLIDFKSAARTTVKNQITEFRDNNLSEAITCSITNVVINRDNCAVDHAHPKTFDQLLLDFAISRNINPLSDHVISTNGVVAEFEDEELKLSWQEYHREHANLRLLSKKGNLQLPKIKVDWLPVINN